MEEVRLVMMILIIIKLIEKQFEKYTFFVTTDN